MLAPFITKSFVKNLDGWLAHNDQASAKRLAAMKASFPQMFKAYPKPLYRGMIVDDSFLQQVDKGLEFKDLTSWSKDKKVALGFVNDPKYRIAKKEGTGILISKTILHSKQILDIYNLCLFFGKEHLEMLGIDALSVNSAFKEQEVLVDKGIKISKKDITFI